jgi:hypothetical protein
MAEGYEAGRRNQSVMSNPYHRIDFVLAQNWFDGWVEGIKAWHLDQLAEFRSDGWTTIYLRSGTISGNNPRARRIACWIVCIAAAGVLAWVAVGWWLGVRP